MELSLVKPRHSLAHLLAQAIQRTIDPAVQLGTGPAVDNGFYYDMLFSEGVSFGEEQIKPLQKTMEGIVKEGQGFACYTAKDIAEAKKIVGVMQQHFKVELLEKFFAQDKNAVYTFWYNYVDVQMLPRLEKTSKPEYTAYYKKITDYLVASSGGQIEGRFVTFIDLCEGGHVENTKEIPDGSFALEKVAGAYRQAKDTNPMMTRIYGLAFETKDALKEYQALMEEAKKRDHRVLGQKLNLFAFSELVGSGLPLFTPFGTIVKNELEKFVKEKKEQLGYTFVCIPHMARRQLYEKSGHMGKYDAMMPVMKDQYGDEYVMKPMNCPHHFELYNSQQYSYRDMPVRFAETTTCYRNEKGGELHGLTRVKALTQDDTHHFVRYDQIESEIEMILNLMKGVYGTFGFQKFKVEISVRDPKKKDKYFGNDDLWSKAENTLIEATKRRGVDYSVEEGEAAFYGPKIDIKVADSIGRYRQLTTVQLDFVQPENFDMTYTGSDGEKHRPAVLHVAILGSSERFMGVVIEHFAGAFPLWLAPTQVKIIPVAEAFNEYANELGGKMKDEGLRIKMDDGNDSFSKKIRNAELMKVPYIVIVGEKEVADKTVSIRVFKTKEQLVLGAEAFVERVKKEYQERDL